MTSEVMLAMSRIFKCHQLPPYQNCSTWTNFISLNLFVEEVKCRLYPWQAVSIIEETLCFQ